MATLKDLAQSLNLSVMAVSKALRDSPDISEKTKLRVVEEARRQNYVPNRAAQNLKSRKSQLFGVVVPQIHYSYYSTLVWGIERQSESIGFQMVLAHSMDRGDLELEQVRKLVSRQIEGLFLIPAVRWQNRLLTLDLLKEARVPVIMLDRYPAGAEQYPRASWVVCRDQQGIEMALQHLFELGHEEILFLAGPQGSSASAARFSGYQRGMDLSPGKYSDHRVFLAGHEIEGGRTAMMQALSEKTPMTAVVAFNDHVAIGAIEILTQQGFRVPEDISVIGFGDDPVAAYFRSGLTTLRIPQMDIGATAVRMMEDLLAGKTIDPREFPIDLIVRQTTAKVNPAFKKESVVA